MARGVPRAEPLAVPHQDRPLREGSDTPCSLDLRTHPSTGSALSSRAARAQGAESGGLLYIMEASGSYNLFVRTANQTNHIHRGSWRRLSTAEQQLGPEPGAGWCQGWRLCPAGAAAAACPRAIFSQHFTVLTIDATARGKARVVRLVGFRQACPLRTWPLLISCVVSGTRQGAMTHNDSVSTRRSAVS